MKFCVLPLSRSLSPSWHSPLTPGKELPPRVFHGDGLSWWRKREEHAHASIPSPFVVSAPVHAQDMTSGTTLPSYACRTQFHTSSLVASCRNILRFISALLELIFSRISFSVFSRISATSYRFLCLSHPSLDAPHRWIITPCVVPHARRLARRRTSCRVDGGRGSNWPDARDFCLEAASPAQLLP